MKRAKLEQRLAVGTVTIHVDARTGARLPKRLLRKKHVALLIGHDLVPPIADLSIDETGVYGTLSFSEGPFPCFVPWAAVFAASHDDAAVVLWQEPYP